MLLFYCFDHLFSEKQPPQNGKHGQKENEHLYKKVKMEQDTSETVQKHRQKQQKHQTNWYRESRGSKKCERTFSCSPGLMRQPKRLQEMSLAKNNSKHVKIIKHHWDICPDVDMWLERISKPCLRDWKVFYFWLICFMFFFLFCFWYFSLFFPIGFWEIQSDESYQPPPSTKWKSYFPGQKSVPTCWGQTWAKCEDPTQV